MDQTSLYDGYLNQQAALPYGLTIGAIVCAANETYNVFRGINNYLETNNQSKLETMLLGNTVSGIISEMVVKHIAKYAPSLEANTKIGGHPDLLPTGRYLDHTILNGKYGLEIKVSQHSGGWQGHNPEAGWLMIFRYCLDPEYSIIFTEILCAKLEETDWTFADRKEHSRRTPTASINKTGMEKLRDNQIYRIPGFGIGKYKQ